MNGVINLKKHKMIFEKKSLHIVVPLYLAEGAWYIELVHKDDSDDNIDCMYKITVWEWDWVNLTVDGRISWEQKISYTSDSDEELQRWQNRLHEVTMMNCNMMIRSLHCVTIEARELLTFDGLIVVDEFLSKFESTVLEQCSSMHWSGHYAQHPRDGGVRIKEISRTGMDVEGWCADVWKTLVLDESQSVGVE